MSSRVTATKPITEEELSYLLEIEKNPLIKQLLADMANAPEERDRETIRAQYRRIGVLGQ
jgi:hypothetical protein